MAIVARRENPDQVPPLIVVPLRAVQRLVKIAEEVGEEEQSLPALLDGLGRVLEGRLELLNRAEDAVLVLAEVGEIQGGEIGSLLVELWSP